MLLRLSPNSSMTNTVVRSEMFGAPHCRGWGERAQPYLFVQTAVEYVAHQHISFSLPRDFIVVSTSIAHSISFGDECFARQTLSQLDTHACVCYAPSVCVCVHVWARVLFYFMLRSEE